MYHKRTEDIPKEGFAGLKQNWRNDLIASLSVALVALPLSMAIAIASGVQPLSGLLSCVIGGFVTTFFRSGKLTINGPAAGLITVIFGAIVSLDDGSGRAINYVLAAIVVSGILQVVLGFLKLGRIAEIFPSSVIHGILAAIGVIIFAKQMHVAIGTSSSADNAVGILRDLFDQLPHANPYIAFISIIGIFLLFFHARISYKVFHIIPAPVWVLAISVPIVMLYNYLDGQHIEFLGMAFEKPTNYLISIPADLTDVFLFPDFSRIDSGVFWLVVLSLTTISSIISLAGAKAIDKLDPFKRKTDLNKDLMGLGASTIVSGMLGGLPILNVIVRSTVNVQNKAKTKYSNFFHGFLVLLFILLLQPVMNMVPLAALAAVLVFAGIKLASPRVFKEVYKEGVEQLVFMVSTLLFTVYNNLLFGLIAGIIITLITHILIARISVPQFFLYVFSPGNIEFKKTSGELELRIRGVANFMTLLKILKKLEEVPAAATLKINFSGAKIIDLTVQEAIDNFKRSHELTGGTVELIGLHKHISSTNHKFALKSSIAPIAQRVSPRQKRLKELSVLNNWEFQLGQDSSFKRLERFHFFDSRPIEYKENIIRGSYLDEELSWELTDVTFSEGAMLAREVYHCTVQVSSLTAEAPTFVLRREEFVDRFIDRVRVFGSMGDLNFTDNQDFSKLYFLKGSNESEIRSFFTSEVLDFLVQNPIYHIECNGNEILIVGPVGVTSISEIENQIETIERLLTLLK
ncbi:MAG: SulP family inorganic anion transporter [Crocinitomicaceae bacterium]|jgi:MFS superfamily sulfate permease-like transporter|tara:strand:+ start:4645 stop:6879 length:2235 start_codon:yes stop_codon:yes gene_type:complete